jgi:hypothetical protein
METTTLFKKLENFVKYCTYYLLAYLEHELEQINEKYILKIARSCPTKKSFTWCFVALLEPYSDDIYINVHYNWCINALLILI